MSVTTEAEKAMYGFRLRTLTDPPEGEVFEAGPFTRFEAQQYGQMRAGQNAMRTGRPWVCDYGEIIKRPKPSKHVAVTIGLIAFIIGVVVSALLLAATRTP